MMYPHWYRLLCSAALLFCLSSLLRAQAVLFDVDFDGDVVDEIPFVDIGFPGETATFATQINGGVLVDEGWTDTVSGERLGGNGDLVATSEAHAITRFNWVDVAEDGLPTPDSSERILTVTFDYLLDSTLAGGGQGPGGQQNIFLRLYNSESTNIGSAFMKTHGGLLVTNENVEYIAPDDPQQFLNSADGIGPFGLPGQFRMHVDLRKWTYQAFVDEVATPVVPLFDDGFAAQDIASFRIEHYDTDGDGGARSDSFLVFDNVLIQLHERDPAGGPVNLQPGDADQDLDFDQLDLVQVQIAAKYLSAGAATWGEGDWDGAPGGSPGSPPPGNGLFDQLDVITALGAGLYLTGPYNAIMAEGVTGDGQTSLIYDANTGELSIDARAGTELTSINIDSTASIFTGEVAQNLGGSFDNDADGNIFKATFGGSFGSVSFGNVAQAGLAQEFILGDLSVVGSLAGGGDLGEVDLIYVPEPQCLFLLGFGTVIVLGRHSRNRSLNANGR